MATATEERIRACLIREGICGEEAATRFAAVLSEEIEAGDADKVTEDRLAVAIAELNASIERLGREFAERDAERAVEIAAFFAQAQELERQRDERERQRAERERERDAKWAERERERDAKWDEREGQRDEREREGNRERDERDRERDEREREGKRERDERDRERDAAMRDFQRTVGNWGRVMFGLWLGSVSALAAVIGFVL